MILDLRKSKFVSPLAVPATVFCLMGRQAGAAPLEIVKDGKSQAVIVVAPEAGQTVQVDVPAPGGKTVKKSKAIRPVEKQAALELQKTIEQMTGAKLAIADTPETVAAAMKGTAPVLVIGGAALQADPTLGKALDKVRKKQPTVRADAIVLRHAGNKILIAGSNDESNYFAVSQLLQDWGCRWYLPTDFGACIPTLPNLSVDALDYAYAPPFEVRYYWLSWNGDRTGLDEFRFHNFMTDSSSIGAGQPLDPGFLKDSGVAIADREHIPFTDPKLAEFVENKLDAGYAAGAQTPGDGGSAVPLGVADAIYQPGTDSDIKQVAGIKDKYNNWAPSMTDPAFSFYNTVAKALREKHPDSKSFLSVLAYTNLTLPPQHEFKAEPNLLVWLAPIDIDPNHGMDDPNSPPQQEYKAMLERWAQLMNGRVAIYDYDQGMLVWRDLPDPSHEMFAENVKHYRDAGILGLGTESRGAAATTFLNLYFRGQLMWNPDADVNAMLDEFYPKFYGPAAAPMKAYWNAIYAAWKNSVVTEHEYFAAPAIYTPQLVEELRGDLKQAQAAMEPLKQKADATPAEKLFVDRMRFTELSFGIIDNYTAMAHEAAENGDYAAAVADGVKGLAARDALTAMNGTFTTYKTIGEHGFAWWPGEVDHYRSLQKLTDGTQGTLVTKAPVEWDFHRDPHDTGIARGFAYNPVDLTYWNANGAKYDAVSRKDYPTDQWERLSTATYMQGQGIRHPDAESYTGYAWYRTPVTLSAAQTAGEVHLMMPGVFNEGWLYVNGNLVAHRDYKEPWWLSDYKFEWDVDVSQALKPGENTIAVRLWNPSHFGGMFRRPFLYRVVGK